MKHESAQVVKPDIEVVIRNDAGELGIVGLFSAGPESWDVVVGIVDDHERAGIEAALQLALTAVQSASFMETRVVGTPDPPW